MALIWIAPKTDWVSTDRFNLTDYNRIKGNLEYLYEFSLESYAHYSIIPMGDDVSDFRAYWRVEVFNAFEDNLDIINSNTVQEDIGMKKVYYENGIFINYDELNRIESQTLHIYQRIEDRKPIRHMLPFRLGEVSPFQ